MPKTRFHNSYYVKCYELSRGGMSTEKIAGVLGVTRTTMQRWMADNEDFRDALQKGKGLNQKANGQGNHGPTFLEYVYDRLPDELKELWDKIQNADKLPNPIRRIEAMLAEAGLRARQTIFVHGLVHANFNVAEACRVANVSRITFEGWCTRDPNFQMLMDQIHQWKKDFVEAGLMGLVRSGDSAATIFASKTLNRDRGYNPQTELVISGMVGHAILDVAKMPFELQKQILDWTEEQRELVPKTVPALTEGEY